MPPQEKGPPVVKPEPAPSPAPELDAKDTKAKDTKATDTKAKDTNSPNIVNSNLEYHSEFNRDAYIYSPKFFERRAQRRGGFDDVKHPQPVNRSSSGAGPGDHGTLPSASTYQQHADRYYFKTKTIPRDSVAYDLKQHTCLFPDYDHTYKLPDGGRSEADRRQDNNPTSTKPTRKIIMVVELSESHNDCDCLDCQVKRSIRRRRSRQRRQRQSRKDLRRSEWADRKSSMFCCSVM
ncbi:hypothetical protein B0H66DRAFT_612489 [Apodospora peruviana]|uniref:Uncharacterized protein n=1 Tax=Apodospora peruviana TaxID=516989 RepID=A0AAE0MFH7_9PEZI|nr:hypothetical protein B0H66DRAFT_612489 [Apodospora peruviana]